MKIRRVSKIYKINIRICKDNLMMKLNNQNISNINSYLCENSNETLKLRLLNLNSIIILDKEIWKEKYFISWDSRLL